MRWPWWRRRRVDDASRARAEAEARLKATRRQTAQVEEAADRVADLDPDEFAAMLADAFSRRET